LFVLNSPCGENQAISEYFLRTELKNSSEPKTASKSWFEIADVSDVTDYLVTNHVNV